MSPPPKVVEQGLYAIKGYLCQKMNSSSSSLSHESPSTKKKPWVEMLVKYGTFNGGETRSSGIFPSSLVKGHHGGAAMAHFWDGQGRHNKREVDTNKRKQPKKYPIGGVSQAGQVACNMPMQSKAKNLACNTPTQGRDTPDHDSRRPTRLHAWRFTCQLFGISHAQQIHSQNRRELGCQKFPRGGDRSEWGTMVENFFRGDGDGERNSPETGAGTQAGIPAPSPIIL
ncbi:hypothetical protein Ahy_A09g046009 [Arachis hypogaea]|uniref:Uncharacterized protein n=1 Tax=Arachis hypogaea TaxID=3818 RepID=A0A445BNN1_ARAHY|nr:hypothetical protein Ahy_A09g046009 [Arachis hypogaea]